MMCVCVGGRGLKERQRYRGWKRCSGVCAPGERERAADVVELK